jgi:hypothetical protein
MSAWAAQGYIYNKAGTALVGITVNAYRIDTGALAGTTTSVGASAGPPPKGAGYWIISGLDTTLEYRIEAIFNASQKVVRTRFNAEMGTLTIFDSVFLPVDTAVFLNGTALNTIYAKLASPTFTGTVTVPTLVVTTGATLPSNGLNVGSGQLNVTGGNVSMSGTLSSGAHTVTSGGISVTGNSNITGTLGSLTGLTVASGTVTLPTNGLNVGSGQLQVSGGNVSMSGNLSVTGLFGLPSTSAGIRALVGTPSASDVPLVVRGAASQSANLFHVQNSGGTDYVVVAATGQLRVRGGGAGYSVVSVGDTNSGIHWWNTDNITVYVNDYAIIDMSHDGSNGRLGFFNQSAIPKPAVTGSRGGNAALASLLTQLGALGLLTDSSTA